MTISEYIQSKSLNIDFIDINIKGLLLTVKYIEGCLLDIENFDIEDLEADIEEVLTIKGRDILLAEFYYLLSSTAGNNERVTADGVTIDKSRSFGVYDRRDFRRFGDELYAKWGLKDIQPPIIGLNSFDQMP